MIRGKKCPNTAKETSHRALDACGNNNAVFHTETSFID